MPGLLVFEMTQNFEKLKEGLPLYLFRDLLDLVRTGILLLGEEGQILVANRHAKDLLGETSLEGQELKKFLDEKDRRVLWPNICALAQKEGSYEGQILLLPVQREPFIALLSLVYYQPKGDQKGFFVATFQDISEFKNLERAMREAKHLVFLGRMLADISHHVRNPILVIGGLARRLKERPSKVESYASAIIYQCERLEELLEALERFVLLPTPRFRLVQVAEIIDLLRERFRLELSGDPPELRLISSAQAEPVAFYTDPALLLEALNELVKNALEAHQLKAITQPVELRVGLKEQKVLFEVADYGDGISIESLPFVFNPFFSTKPGHLGMGLTLASRIAEELDGKLEVTHLHQPTVVSLSLPLDRRRRERRELLVDYSR